MSTLNLHEIVIGLFDKRESHIQIFKHICTEFYVLMKMLETYQPQKGECC